MAATGFALLLLGIISGTIGSQLDRWSGPSILDSIKALNQTVLKLENSLPLMIQAAKETILLHISDNMASFRKEFQTLQSNHCLRVDQLEDDLAQTNRNLRNQNVLIEKLSHQLEDIQSYMTCDGEPPSSLNGKPVDFERKHGSEVRYLCEQNFVQPKDSKVRCHFGKWEGQPPDCRSWDHAFSLRSQMEGDDGHFPRVSTVSCSSEDSPHSLEISRVLDTGSGPALPTGARTYSRGRSVVLDLTGVTHGDKRGFYECRSVRNGKRKKISFVIGRLGQFRRPPVVSIGGSVLLGGPPNDPSYRWLHDGEHVLALDGRGKLEIAGVRNEDAGFYEIYKLGDRRERHYMGRLVVRKCPANFFGERCEQNCTTCYNGGVCHIQLGTCVCSPGFKGEQCELACGENRVGQNCSEPCEGGDCKKQIFCMPDPYGCSCAAGYYSYYCDKECKEGTFGAECKQTCHCATGSCDPITGACSRGCSQGWSGPSCQIPAES